MRILAFDLGTSSVRALVLDAEAVPLPGALARRKVRVEIRGDGAGVLDARSYCAALVECLDELAEHGQLDDIGLVAGTGQWHSVLPVDRAGQPMGPALTWLDTRPEPSPEMPRPADEQDFHRRTGTWLHRCYWSARLPWVRARCGDGLAGFTGLVEYVLGSLLEDLPMSISQASGTGLLDLRTLDWDPEALAIAGVRPGELPPLAPPDWRGRLRPRYARRWPALRDVPWVAPVGDGAAANVGSGCVGTDRAAVTVGTSAAVRLVQPAPAGDELPPLPHGLWRYRVDREHVVTGAAYSAGGNLFAWARRELRLPDGPDLDEALELIPLGCGVTADPRFGGDRPPGTVPVGSGRLSGLGFGTTAVEIVASLMESLCHQVAADVVELESMVDRPVAVILNGGAIAASDWWRRAFAAVLAPRVVRHQPDPEVGATGAALIALGRVDRAGAAADISRTEESGLPTTPGEPCPQYPS